MKTKNERKAPIPEFPSFVYRQDGFELSYMIGCIIPPNAAPVKKRVLYFTHGIHYTKVNPPEERKFL